jgi:ferritin-like metal-binding protein YciE/sporulation protein YlmC with PRC-barrel domain
LALPIPDVRELFVHELGDIYDAEHRFLEGQREMAQEATDQDLKEAIQQHIEQTDEHIRNLEQVYDVLGQEPERVTSEVAQGLVSKAQEDIQESQGEAIRDCAINAAVIRVEHFEMGSYRGMLTGARQLGQQEAVDLLEKNLRQEEETAQTAEQSAPELLQKAQEAAEQQQSNLVKLGDSNLRLDEPWQDIRELDVYDINGEQIGSVEDLYADREERLPRFLDVSAGGFLGIGKKHFLVPVEEVSRDVGEEDRVIVNQSKDKVMGSPNFDPDQVPPLDLQRAVLAYYGYS